jgi:hypothetical protein
VALLLLLLLLLLVLVLVLLLLLLVLLRMRPGQLPGASRLRLPGRQVGLACDILQSA